MRNSMLRTSDDGYSNAKRRRVAYSLQDLEGGKGGVGWSLSGLSTERMPREKMSSQMLASHAPSYPKLLM